MKLISCNVSGRIQTTLGRQLDLLLAQEADVIALQEVTPSSYDDWSEGLVSAKYSVVDTSDLVALPFPRPPLPKGWFHPGARPETQIRRKNFNLIASRYPIARLPGLRWDDLQERKFAYPEKHVAARISIKGREVHVHNTHLPPGSSRGLIKVHAFEAISRRIKESTRHPIILCGDFNAPWEENDDGPVAQVPGEGRGPHFPRKVGQRWSAAEARLLSNPRLRDVYRDRHKAGDEFPCSYYTGRTKLKPHRYDYIFASDELKSRECNYLTDWLERDNDGWRPSDHAPVEAVLSLKPPTN